MNYQLITCGPFGEDLCHYIRSTYPDLGHCTFVENINQEDLDGKDAIAGFYQFDSLDLSGIQWVHAFGAGVDTYLRQPTLRPDTRLTRTLGYMDKRIGEFCLAYILADLKLLISTSDNQRRKYWERKNLDVLYDKKVLIFGTGFIGTGIATALRGLTGSITGISYSGTSRPAFDQVSSITSLPALTSYDVVINTLPLTSITDHYFDLKFYQKLDQALFINVGRGKSVVETDLVSALEQQHVRKAILDVFQEEPLASNSPLWDHPSVVVTPHQSGRTTFEDIKKSFDEVVSCLYAGKRNQLFVDLEKGY